MFSIVFRKSKGRKVPLFYLLKIKVKIPPLDVSILSYEEEGKRLGRDLDEILFEIVDNRIGNSSQSTHYLYGGGILVSSAFQTNIFVEREF